MKGKIFGFVVVLAVVFAWFNDGICLEKGKTDRDSFYKELNIFAEGLALIEKKYVEDKLPKDLIYGAMDGLLASLDSYSQFLDPDEYKELIVETEGKFGGLGIEITMKDNLLTIVSPIEDTPAWHAGAQAGDIIVKIDGELTKGITLSEAVKKLRGEPGSKVVITVLRDKTRKLEDITIVRGIIRIKDIKRALILEGNIGYLRIAEFRENTARDMDKELLSLKKTGLEGLIIDVRNNPGGLLYSAIEIASRFVEDGKIIVSTKSRSEKEMVYTSVPAKEKYLDLPLVVLINKGSASGSEILAAALRENGKAILLGETTFGKGSVQTVIPLSDGAALRLTTSKYYTPKGESIHEKGIEADVTVVPQEDVTGKREDVFKGLERKEDFDYRKDYQIIRALDLIKGLLVLSESN
ncbi:MAG: S41 family peptidase [Candidatus Omnitrophota bacterium]|nr:MAG: S41 family peptidase [Candidatus Omnitrophota bacterium]